MYYEDRRENTKINSKENTVTTAGTKVQECTANS